MATGERDRDKHLIGRLQVFRSLCSLCSFVVTSRTTLSTVHTPRSTRNLSILSVFFCLPAGISAVALSEGGSFRRRLGAFRAAPLLSIQLPHGPETIDINIT
jgi:hypothetical protein